MARRGLARFDDEYRIRWGDLLAGVDEAGRGPLAGPVVAACVVLRPGTRIHGVRDSKVMTAVEREEALDRIRAREVAMAVGEGSVVDVEAVNMHLIALLSVGR